MYSQNMLTSLLSVLHCTEAAIESRTLIIYTLVRYPNAASVSWFLSCMLGGTVVGCICNGIFFGDPDRCVWLYGKALQWHDAAHRRVRFKDEGKRRQLGLKLVSGRLT